MTRTLLRKHFQQAYVVRDVDRAMAAFGTRFGVADWHVMRFPDEAPSRAIALAYVDDLMLELIEPSPGVPSIYSDWLPAAEDDARFHHLGFFIHSDEEWQQAMEEFAAAGISEAWGGNEADILSYHYADTVSMLGHYTELVYLKPAGIDMFAPVPRN